MLENSPWSQTPDGVFQSCDSDSRKEAVSLTLNARMPECTFANDNVEPASHVLSSGGSILDDKSVLEENVCQYPLNHMSNTDNELGFLDNEHDAKENNDILDYEWLDIENFEDVDRMFSNCDSTFGMECLNNDEDLCWLSSSHDTEVSNGALKSNLKFTCSEGGQLESFLDYNGDSKVKNLGSSMIDSSHDPFAMGKNMASGSTNVDAEITASGPSSVTSETYVNSDLMDNIMAKEQKKQLRQQKVLKGSRKDVNIQNGDYVPDYTNLEHYTDRKHPFAVTSGEVLSPVGIQQHNVGGHHGSLSYVQRHGCFMPSDQGALGGITPCQNFSATKTGNNAHSSYSPRESSDASIAESIQGHSSENSALVTKERREELYYHPNMQVLSTQFKSKREASAIQSENENEGESEIEIGFCMDLESPNVLESSSMSSELADVSVEATSFRQLQKVMDQLDIRTKLLIRDSLYRLAKSAEQRHNHLKGEICKESMHLDDHRCTRFVDIETETNPIDRSIAHLLYHRPSDPSTLPVSHVHLKSNAGDEELAGAEQQKPSVDEDKL